MATVFQCDRCKRPGGIVHAILILNWQTGPETPGSGGPGLASIAVTERPTVRWELCRECATSIVTPPSTPRTP